MEQKDKKLEKSKKKKKEEEEEEEYEEGEEGEEEEQKEDVLGEDFIKDARVLTYTTEAGKIADGNNFADFFRWIEICHFPLRSRSENLRNYSERR
jgi:hypothetical protein